MSVAASKRLDYTAISGIASKFFQGRIWEEYQCAESEPACNLASSSERKDAPRGKASMVYCPGADDTIIGPWKCGLFLQEVLNRLSSLPRPVLILDERETHVAFAERPESDAWRHSHQRFFQEQLREFE